MSFDIGKRLKKLRNHYNISQIQMAELADIDDKYYGRLERNESAPTIAIIEKICKGLGITLVHFFMPPSTILKNDGSGEFKIQKAQAENLQREIDIHFNRDALLKDCCHCLWYSGYIASAYIDELELQLTAEGNIRAQIFQNYVEVATINEQDASNELLKYIKNDTELNELMIREEYDEALLKEYEGNAIFVSESNWLALSLINHLSGELLAVFSLDTEDIYEPFMGENEALDNYFFNLEND